MHKKHIGLTNYILVKHRGALNIPCIKYHDCIQSSITRTLFFFKIATLMHLKSKLNNFLLHTNPLEATQMVEAIRNSHLLYINLTYKKRTLNSKTTFLSSNLQPSMSQLMPISPLLMYSISPTPTNHNIFPRYKEPPLHPPSFLLLSQPNPLQ